MYHLLTIVIQVIGTNLAIERGHHLAFIEDFHEFSS